MSHRGRAALIAGLVLSCLSGCGPPAPKTYPLTGKVVFKGGDIKQLDGWTVQLQLEGHPENTSVAGINADGTFEAMTVVNNMGKKGLLEGRYRACVIDVLNPDAKAINAQFMGFDTSGFEVTVPAEGEFIIEVSK